MNLKKFFDKVPELKSKKNIYYILIVLLLGVLLILVGDIMSSLGGSKIKKENNKDVAVNTVGTSTYSYEEKIKKDLKDILSSMKGVGKVNVMIYFEGGVIYNPAVNINDTNRNIEEKDNQGGVRKTTESTVNHSILTINEGGGTKPYIINTKNPTIGGVVVVAEGAESSDIKEKIQIAVKTVLNITSNKVYVMPMKKDGGN